MTSPSSDPFVFFLTVIQQYKRPTRLARALKNLDCAPIIIPLFTVEDPTAYKDAIRNSIIEESGCRVINVETENAGPIVAEKLKAHGKVVFHLFCGFNWQVLGSVYEQVQNLKKGISPDSLRLVVDFYDVAFAHEVGTRVRTGDDAREPFEHYRIDLKDDSKAEMQAALYQEVDGVVARDLQFWHFRRCQGLTKKPSCFIPDVPNAIRTRDCEDLADDNIRIIQSGNVPTPEKGAFQSNYTITRNLVSKRVQFTFLLPLQFRRRNRTVNQIKEMWADVLAIPGSAGNIFIEATILDSANLVTRLAAADIGIHGTDGYVEHGISRIARDKPLVASFCAGRLADYAEAGLPILGMRGLRLSKKVLRSYTSWVDLEDALAVARDGGDVHAFLTDACRKHRAATFPDAKRQTDRMADRLIEFYGSLYHA